MRSKCASSSSTAWFCWDMPTARLPGSRSGRSSVGPNTMPMFWHVMRLTSACPITLGMHKIQGEGRGVSCNPSSSPILPLLSPGACTPGLHRSDGVP